MVNFPTCLFKVASGKQIKYSKLFSIGNAFRMVIFHAISERRNLFIEDTRKFLIAKY